MNILWHRNRLFDLYRCVGCTLFIFLLTTYSKSQVVIESLPRWMVTSHAGMAWSQMPVIQFLDGNSTTFKSELFYRLQHNAPWLGGVYYQETGRLSRYVLRYTQVSQNGEQTRIREKARTIRRDFGLTAGFYPELNWLFQPYITGSAGLALFTTSSILFDRRNGEEIDRIRELTRSVPTLGIDIGFQFVPNIWLVRFDLRFGMVTNPSVTFMALDKANAGTTGYPKIGRAHV